jgi:hypothetical protein
MADVANTVPKSEGYPMSTKRETFVRLAEARINKALKDVELVGNLCNRSAYEYSDDDVKKMFKTLQDAVAKAKQRFADAGSKSSGSFKL